MLKPCLLCALVCISVSSFGQTKNTTDTIPKTDSVLTELKNDVLDNLPVVTLDENDLGDGGNQNVSSVLSAGRDPFYSAASYNFSSVRFRIRGYDNDYFSTYMNGIPMDNLDNGFTPYGLWGGLNDVMRNREVSFGLNYTSFAFGDIGGNSNIDSRASRQRAQTSFSYANANRNYTHRWMFTHSTGMSKKGWAFSLSGSRRWAEEGNVAGTYYDGWSYFAAADKRLGQKQLLSLVAFGAPTENGRQGASVTEMINLSGDHYYNPNWGYQNGQKRNASVGKTHQPVIILTHDFRIKNNMSLITAAGYTFGNRSVTAIDWYNAPDPRPDYYRYLPSYTRTYSSSADQQQADELEKLMRADINLRQINWQRLYDANRSDYMTVNDANGASGKTVSGLRSHYIIEDRVINTGRLNLNTVLNTRVNEHFDLMAGITYQSQKNNYYKKVDDLLGGDFYLNLNQFAERDNPTDTTANQNDVDHPNRILKVGDKFGYDYNIDLTSASAWSQGVFKFSDFDFFVAGQFIRTTFQRTGHVKSGLFPTDSYGASKLNEFNDFGVKGGVTYKINGRNYVYVNAAYLTKAPFFDNVYVSPRTRNAQQPDVQSEIIRNAEGGYIMHSPNLKIRVSGYIAQMQNQMEVLSFFHDSLQNFVNYGISGINKLHFGGEFGVEAKLTAGLTVNAAAALGRYYYDSKQHAVITADNTNAVLGEQVIYAENFRIPSTPQEAYSLGLTYRSPKFWFVSLTGNYFDQSYLSRNPLRRTYNAVGGLDPKSDIYKEIFDQTKFDANYTIDFFGGYSWKMPKQFNVDKKSVFMVFNLGVNNILNNKDIVTGGYEQLRFDPSALGKFPPKFYYAYGLNYFASVTVRF
jgi:hypothetical protein